MALAFVLVAGERQRLATCDAPGCERVLVDLSRNRSRRYCDSRTCGNRLHVAAYRARQQHRLTRHPAGLTTPDSRIRPSRRPTITSTCMRARRRRPHPRQLAVRTARAGVGAVEHGDPDAHLAGGRSAIS